jgi:multiple sugar transport system permease protein
MRSCCYRAARSVTVPVTLGKFLVGDEAPWNYLMAAAIIYAIRP